MLRPVSTEPKKRRGRPPRDPASAPAGRQAFHVGMRFNDLRETQVMRLVSEANERARKADVPVNVTASSLIHAWIIEKIEEEIAKSDRKKR